MPRTSRDQMAVSSDFKDLLRLFADYQVEYLVIDVTLLEQVERTNVEEE